MSLHFALWSSEVSRKRDEIASQYKHIKKAIINRDGERCAICKTTEDLCIDHIHQVSNGGSNELSNLRLLCRKCNLATKKVTPDGKPCLLCGNEAAGRFNGWLCKKHLDECREEKLHHPRWWQQDRILTIIKTRYAKEEAASCSNKKAAQ